MSNDIIQIVLINLYWLSLPFIGYAILLFISEFHLAPTQLSKYARSLVKSHAFILFFASFLTFCCLAAPIITLLYVVGAPVKVAVLIYVAVITLASFYVFGRMCMRLFRSESHDWLKLNREQNILKMVTVGVIITLIIDYAIALYVQSNPSGDTNYHLTRILSMVTNGYFNASSGYFTNVIDAAYHTNFIYSLHIIPSRLFNAEPVGVWAYSFSFFRLVQWMGIFTLAYALFKIFSTKSTTIMWSMLATLIAIGFFSYVFFIATYPNMIVGAWMVSMIIVLILYLQKNDKTLLIALIGIAFLITMTHATYALISALFLVYWLFLHCILYYRHRILQFVQRYKGIALVVVVLLVNPIYTKLMPSHLTSKQAAIGDVKTLEFYGLSMKDISYLIPQSWLEAGLALLSLAGFVYLMYLLYQKKSKNLSIVLASVSFSYVVHYFPPLYSILKVVLPLWVIDRFVRMNVFELILPFVGIACLSALVSNLAKWPYIISKIQATKFNRVVLVSLSLICFAITIPVTYGSLLNLKTNSAAVSNNAKTSYQGFDQNLPSNSRILASLDISSTLPARVPVNVVAVLMGHSTMSADTGNRLACHERMLNTLDLQDLTYANVDYVILPNEKNNYAISKSYLEPSFENKVLSVFKVDKLKSINESRVFTACKEYQLTESKNYFKPYRQ